MQPLFTQDERGKVQWNRLRRSQVEILDLKFFFFSCPHLKDVNCWWDLSLMHPQGGATGKWALNRSKTVTKYDKALKSSICACQVFQWETEEGVLNFTTSTTPPSFSLSPTSFSQGLQLYFTWQKAGMKIDYLWSHFCHPQEDLNITIRILLLEQKFWFLLKINLTCVKETRIRTHRVMNKIDFCDRWFFL